MMDVPNNCVAFVTGWAVVCRFSKPCTFGMASRTQHSLCPRCVIAYSWLLHPSAFPSLRLWRKLPARVRGGRSHARGSCD